MTARLCAPQIEEHVLHTIKEEQLFARLSPQEQEFAKGWVLAYRCHLRCKHAVFSTAS
jgi:hypothetical protein